MLFFSSIFSVSLLSSSFSNPHESVLQSSQYTHPAAGVQSQLYSKMQVSHVFSILCLLCLFSGFSFFYFDISFAGHGNLSFQPVSHIQCQGIESNPPLSTPQLFLTVLPLFSGDISRTAFQLYTLPFPSVFFCWHNFAPLHIHTAPLPLHPASPGATEAEFQSGPSGRRTDSFPSESPVRPDVPVSVFKSLFNMSPPI